MTDGRLELISVEPLLSVVRVLVVEKTALAAAGVLLSGDVDEGFTSEELEEGRITSFDEVVPVLPMLSEVVVGGGGVLPLQVP